MNEYHQWNYDYPKLLWESGFQFSAPKMQSIRNLIENNCLSFMDLDRIIKERDVCTVDKHIDTVVNYTIDPNDMTVLDKSFVNVFRLAQLAIEYLLSCKRHLDTHLAYLKNDLIKLQEENYRLRDHKTINENKLDDWKRKVKDLKRTVHNYQQRQQQQRQQQQQQQQQEKENVHFACDVCSKGFETASKLENHRSKQHRESESLKRIEDDMQNLKALLANNVMAGKEACDKDDKDDELKVLDDLDAAIDERQFESKQIQTDTNETKCCGIQSDMEPEPNDVNCIETLALENHLKDIMQKLEQLERNARSVAEVVHDPGRGLSQECVDTVPTSIGGSPAKTTVDQSSNRKNANDLVNEELLKLGIDPILKAINTNVFQQKLDQFRDEKTSFRYAKDPNSYKSVEETILRQIDDILSKKLAIKSSILKNGHHSASNDSNNYVYELLTTTTTATATSNDNGRKRVFFQGDF